VNSRGLRLGNHAEVREAIELALQNIYEGKMTISEGLDAVVRRGTRSSGGSRSPMVLPTREKSESVPCMKSSSPQPRWLRFVAV